MVKDGLALAGDFGLGGGVKPLLMVVLMGCATSLWAGNTLTFQQVEINRSGQSHGVSPVPPVPPTFAFSKGSVVISAKKPAKPAKHVSVPVISHPTQPPTGSMGDDGIVLSEGGSIGGSSEGVMISSGVGMFALLPPSINEGVFLSASGTLVNFYGSAVVGAVSGVPQP